MRLSIVIPHYNHTHEIGAAVAGVFAQTVTPHEVIVVDDGSTQDIAILAELEKHWPLRVIRHPSNQGVNAACNTGLANVSGDFVLFTAADDRIDREMVEKIGSVAGREGILFSDPAEMNSDGSRRRVFPLYLGNTSRHFEADEFQRLIREQFFYLSVASVWFNVPKLREIGGFDVKLRWHADYFAAYALGMLAGATYVPGALSHFAVSPQSYSAQGHRSAEQKDVLLAWLDKTREPQNTDVRDAFIRSCLLPEYSLRSLWAARSDPAYLTPRLLGRILLRSLWNTMRPAFPLGWRRRMRRTLSRSDD